jgi:hypothetical protein
MKKIITICLLLLAGYSTLSNASVVNVISSNGAFAGNSVASLTSLSLLSDTQIASNLSDNDARTYLFGSDSNGTVSTASLTLGFQDTFSNQAGDDISFFFMGGTSEINSMQICFTSNCDPTTSSIFNSSFINGVNVNIGDGNTYALSIISFDLTDFGFASSATLDQFSIDIIAGGYNRLASIDNLNTITAVPVPAAAWLFLSGLSLFGWFGRRK